VERTLTLAAALGFVALLAGLTLSVVVDSGLDILSAISLLVLALVASGIVGALRHPPSE
jgi:hypothetical protein